MCTGNIGRETALGNGGCGERESLASGRGGRDDEVAGGVLSFGGLLSSPPDPGTMGDPLFSRTGRTAFHGPCRAFRAGRTPAAAFSARCRATTAGAHAAAPAI